MVPVVDLSTDSAKKNKKNVGTATQVRYPYLAVGPIFPETPPFGNVLIGIITRERVCTATTCSVAMLVL